VAFNFFSQNKKGQIVLTRNRFGMPDIKTVIGDSSPIDERISASNRDALSMAEAQNKDIENKKQSAIESANEFFKEQALNPDTNLNIREAKFTQPDPSVFQALEDVASYSRGRSGFDAPPPPPPAPKYTSIDVSAAEKDIDAYKRGKPGFDADGGGGFDGTGNGDGTGGDGTGNGGGGDVRWEYPYFFKDPDTGIIYRYTTDAYQQGGTKEKNWDVSERYFEDGKPGKDAFDNAVNNLVKNFLNLDLQSKISQTIIPTGYGLNDVLKYHTNEVWKKSMERDIHGQAIRDGGIYYSYGDKNIKNIRDDILAGNVSTDIILAKIADAIIYPGSPNRTSDYWKANEEGWNRHKNSINSVLEYFGSEADLEFDYTNRLSTDYLDINTYLDTVADWGPKGTQGVGPGGKEDIGVRNTETGNLMFEAGSYSSVPWEPIYTDFLKDTLGAGGSPAQFQFLREQGLASDPLLRTAYTNFLVQATEDDPWGGQVNPTDALGFPSEAKVGSRIFDTSKTTNDNAYNSFMQSYQPLDTNNAVNSVKDIINVLNRGKQWRADTNYSDTDLRDFRWIDRFGSGSQYGERNQQALAALPIIQNTPGVLRNETSNILNSIYNDWYTNPNKKEDENWLEFVEKNNFFGMVGEAEGKRPRGI